LPELGKYGIITMKMIKTLLWRFYIWKDYRKEIADENFRKRYACSIKNCIYNLDGEMCYGMWTAYKTCHKYEWKQERKRKRREKVGLL